MACFHATDGEGDGWENRKCRCQRVEFGPEGPYMGGCVGHVTRDVGIFERGDPNAGGDGGKEGGGGGKREKLKGLLGSVAKKI